MNEFFYYGFKLRKSRTTKIKYRKILGKLCWKKILYLDCFWTIDDIDDNDLHSKKYLNSFVLFVAQVWISGGGGGGRGRGTQNNSTLINSNCINVIKSKHNQYNVNVIMIWWPKLHFQHWCNCELLFLLHDFF